MSKGKHVPDSEKPYLNTSSTPILTERQKEILTKICEGKSYRVIAKELYISLPTVKYHVKNIFNLLHVKNKAQAIRVAIINDLVK
ncbi:MAG: hypothetical protein GF353_24890 [Candidatus Lokiarchaeota archaeon]|nr:hypothetical protein [Candidatus Lokiarchaeota archaeon]